MCYRLFFIGFELLTAMNTFENDCEWWMNTYEIHSITNKMPSAVIDVFLLGILSYFCTCTRFITLP